MRLWKVAIFGALIGLVSAAYQLRRGAVHYAPEDAQLYLTTYVLGSAAFGAAVFVVIVMLFGKRPRRS